MIVFDWLLKRARFVYPLIVLLVASCVYMIGYNTPSSLFWDENYHIASAQKYLDGVMFMEPHPPFGKMLLALGEWALDPNSDLDKSKLVTTDYLEDRHVPDDLSFSGFRLMSVVLMAFAAPFFYFILLYILGNRHLAFLFSALFLFDNALIVHSRAAMLEGIQIFFALTAIWYWVRTIVRGRPVRLFQYGILGVLVSLTVAVKVNGAVMLLLFPMLYGYDQWPQIRRMDWRAATKRLASAVPVGAGALSVVLLSVMYLHIAMGTQIEAGKTYKASPEYRQLIRGGETAGWRAFVVGLRDNWRYMSQYADSVPSLDVCKDDENGSAAIAWPLGGKTINYRWSKNTVDGETRVRYLYLAGNPIVWFSVLGGIILSVSLILGRVVYGVRLKNTALFYWATAFTVLYAGYMIAILQIERVMYLYHYFLPLVFGMINLPIVFSYIYREQIMLRSRHLYINVAVFVALILAVFWHFAPFSYYFSLAESEFALRQWFDFWRLAPVR